jgi:hypothetical protein
MNKFKYFTEIYDDIIVKGNMKLAIYYPEHKLSVIRIKSWKDNYLNLTYESEDGRSIKTLRLSDEEINSKLEDFEKSLKSNIEIYREISQIP